MILKRNFCFISLVFICSITLSQTFQIGQTSITYNDPDRNNRSIPVQIFYPSNSAGTNVPVAIGEFPVVVFGHGFVMVYSAYQYLWQALAPQGYILVLPTTEGGLSPNHLALGLDLRFLIGKMKSEGLNQASLFHGHVADGSAIMGHSMGGGAAFLACQNFSDVSAMITFAAAETNPSAIQAAAAIQVPALVFSGSNDCVTPPPNHQVPMYNNLASSCKTFISITGGGHCYFADYNFNCAFGELTCSPSPAITREQQHAIILAHLIPYLDFHLKENQQSWITFNHLLNNPSGITSIQNCNLRLIEVKAILEGPFNGTDMNAAMINLPDFPQQQPYHTEPWNYEGTESISANPPDVVDWILVELRDAASAASANAGTRIAMQAALLKTNGSVVSPEGEPYLRFNATISQQLFILIRHRNHLPVLSANPLTLIDGLYVYDFTPDPSNTYSGSNGCAQLPNNLYGLIAGDINADGLIDLSDKSSGWNQESGTEGYLQSDIDLNGQADNPDKNDFWLKNEGKVNQVPE